MRIVFGVLSLLIVVAVIGILGKKQLTAIAPVPAPASTGAPADSVAAPSGTPKQQVQQYKQAVEGAMQQARPMPDDK
jgi:Na+-transporting methylmalonyl-CoA/oxaloacetate decarboxylase gamma subunit